MITDVNVYLSRWPCRRLPDDETPKLVKRLRDAKITEAWAGTFDGLLHRDVAGANIRLAEECRTSGEGVLIPFGSINITLPDWKEDLRRCHEIFKMPGIRVQPNYHGYALDDPRFAELLKLAEERALIVQIVLKMEDERTQHPLLHVKPVDPRPLLGLLPKFPRLRVVILNGLLVLRGEELAKLAACPNVAFDFGMLEGVGGLATLVKTIPFERVLCGSYAPFFYVDSALLKLRESELGGFMNNAITHGNAARILGQRS